MSGRIWRLEWRVTLARRRRLAWSVLVPTGLLVPVAASGAAPAHRATAYALFVVFFGLFGAAAPVVRDAQSGWLERLLLTGYGARRWLLERTAAHAVQDLLQLAPALTAVGWLEGVGSRPAAAATAGAGALLALVAANLIGTVAGAVVRSLAEGALACAAAGLVALHLTGAFRPPAAGTWQEVAAAASPFLPVVEGFRAIAGTAAGLGGAAAWAGPAGAGTVLLAAAWAAAPWIAGRLTGAAAQL